MKQRTEEWFAARLGKITGTRAADLMGTATTRKTLLATLIKEAVTADSKTIRTTPEMQRGIDLEPHAISHYELLNCVTVADGGFVELSHIVAASPDGLIGEHGGIEVKCLSQENHIKVILADEIDKKHYWQIVWCMFVAGCDWWDYFGYCPELPEPLTTYTKRFERDPMVMESLSESIVKFTLEYTGLCDKLNISI